MPFLPSEGEETKLLINQQMKVFHYVISFSLFTNFMVSLSNSK
jgi:hypothetical protein